MINLINKNNNFPTNIPTNDSLIILGIVLMALAIIIPCLIWFTRNLLRICFKKEFWWLSSLIKISWIIGIVIFVIGLVLLVIKLIQ